MPGSYSHATALEAKAGEFGTIQVTCGSEPVSPIPNIICSNILLQTLSISFTFRF